MALVSTIIQEWKFLDVDYLVHISCWATSSRHSTRRISVCGQEDSLELQLMLLGNAFVSGMKEDVSAAEPC